MFDVWNYINSTSHLPILEIPSQGQGPAKFWICPHFISCVSSLPDFPASTVYFCLNYIWFSPHPLLRTLPGHTHSWVHKCELYFPWWPLWDIMTPPFLYKTDLNYRVSSTLQIHCICKCNHNLPISQHLEFININHKLIITSVNVLEIVFTA